MDITEGAMNENENTDLGVADYDAASPIQRAAAVPCSRTGRCRYRNAQSSYYRKAFQV